MNLTVGPLPPAVYWRRRAIVLGAVLLVIVFLISMCSGSGDAGSSGTKKTAATGSGSPAPGGSSSPSTSSTLPPIITGSPGAGATGDPAAASSETPTGSQPSASVTCSDNDIALTAAVIPQQSGFNFSLKVKNTSQRACNRDVGADPQELHVVQNGQIIWSSDYCQTVHGQPDVRTFGPGVESVFTIHWDQRITQPGCTKGAVAGTGSYEVVAKLDTKVSSPTSFQIGK